MLVRKPKPFPAFSLFVEQVMGQTLNAAGVAVVTAFHHPEKMKFNRATNLQLAESASRVAGTAYFDALYFVLAKG